MQIGLASEGTSRLFGEAAVVVRHSWCTRIETRGTREQALAWIEQEIERFCMERGYHEDGQPDPWRRFERFGERSDRFWEIRVDGPRLATAYGAMGLEPQCRSKQHEDGERAAKEAEKAIRAKLKGGYVEVTGLERSAERIPSQSSAPGVPGRSEPAELELALSVPVPPLPEVDPAAPLTEHAARAMQAALRDCSAMGSRERELPWSRIRAYVEGTGPPLEFTGVVIEIPSVRNRLEALVREVALTPRQVIRLLLALELDPRFVYEEHYVALLQAYGSARGRAIDLRLVRDELAGFPSEHLSGTLEELPPARHFIHLMLCAWGMDGFLEMEDDVVWPLFAEDLGAVLEVLEWTESGARREYRQAEWNGTRERLYAALAKFPELPGFAIPHLWKDAIEGSRRLRPFAQAALARTPDLEAKVAAHLDANRPEDRIAAAEWLADLGAKRRLEDVARAAESTETGKQRTELMRALERLGGDAGALVDREALLTRAKKALERELPTSLDLFPFEGVPVVHWSEDGEAVPAEVVHGWVVECVRRKDARPDPELRSVLRALRPEDGAKLADFVLDFWLERSGSALTGKGVLALASACGDAGCVDRAQRYIRRWYGNRYPQCVALLQMVRGIEHPRSIQLLVSLAERFRTRGIQKEARKLLDEVAERHGWSQAELADRCVPTADLESDGRLLLDYGARILEAYLDDALELVVCDDKGKVRKSAPAARAGEDGDRVAEEKKRFSRARKEARQTVNRQRERMGAAMALQRSWSASDWRALMLAHPLMGRCSQQVVWAATDPHDEGAPARGFRPDAEGVLHAADGSAIHLRDSAEVRIAHFLTLPEDERDAWIGRLKSEERPSWIEQFRPPPPWLEDPGASRAVTEFVGCIVDGRELLGGAGKLGYARGEILDRGYFYDFVRAIPEAGVTACIRFSGMVVETPSGEVALRELEFVAWKPTPIDSQAAPKIPLADLPPVLLSECWNDFAAIAARATEQDPDWEKRLWALQ